jgi:hypothetical protein
VPFLREECQLDVRLQEMRIDAENVEYEQPRRTTRPGSCTWSDDLPFAALGRLSREVILLLVSTI